MQGHSTTTSIKKVNENWGKELSKAKISVNVEFIINSMGAVR